LKFRAAGHGFWWTLTALAIVAIALIIWRWCRNGVRRLCSCRRFRRTSAPKQKLDEALALIAQPKPFVIAVSDTARAYLEERFNFRAPERTTEEFLRE